MKTRNYTRIRNPNFELNSRTLELLTQFGQVEWFIQSGKTFDDPGVTHPANTSDALHSFFSRGWENIRLEAQNNLSGFLSDNYRQLFSETWNDIVHFSEPILQPSFLRIQAAAKNRLLVDDRTSDKLQDLIRRDFFGACHESEYADVAAPSLYSEMSRWYLAGHFPCGYEGQWPNGRLIVW